MSHRNPQARETPNKAFAKAQKVFVPRTHNHNNQTSKDRNPTTSLSNSLRKSLPGQSDSGGGRFVRYLPQDEAVAAGLGADVGGLDPVVSQKVVDHSNRELSWLLKLNPKEFWKEVASDTSLHEFLDSFLQFRIRWYDFAYHGPKEMVAGVIVGEVELSRRVFMVLYRISSNRDPGARAGESLNPKDHGVLLQEKKLLDLPKLLDICALYGQENGDLTRILVKNAISAQPWIHDSLTSVISQFLSIVHTMHQRCVSSLEVLFSSGSHVDHDCNRLFADLLEVMDFINDAIVSMDAFINSYKPAALFFSFPIEIRDGNEELLCTLAKLHDSLIPSLQRGFHVISSSGQGAKVPNIGIWLNLLAMRIIKFGWNLLDFCYLSDEAFGGDLPIPSATKMFPANIEDPLIRADILVQTFREISSVSISYQENQERQTLLQNIDKYFHITSRMEKLQNTGWIFMDEEQLDFICGIFGSSKNAPSKELPTVQIPVTSNKAIADEDSVIMESKISQIKDLFPDYGKGFLAACLEAYNHNPEEVVQRILEGTLHKDLQTLDTSLEAIPVSTTTAITVSKKDKGKGKLVESEPTVSLPSNSVAGGRKPNEVGPSVSSSSYSTGRYVRKSKALELDSTTLDGRSENDHARTAAILVQYEDEYEDEYDDSFDDLGLGVAESGEAEVLGDRIRSGGGNSWESGRGGEESRAPPQNPSDSGKWGSRKKPQYYVKDGKNYSYKVEGSVAVANASEASLVTQAGKELIHGLGRGGNLPLGAVKQLMEASGELNDSNNKQRGVSEMETEGGRSFGNNRGRGRRGGGGGGAPRPKDSITELEKQSGPTEAQGGRGEIPGGNHRGRGRGRGGGGGGRNNNYRRDRAAAKHFSGLGGF